MPPILYAVSLPRPLSPAEAQTLCLAADAKKRAQYAQHPDLPYSHQSLASQALLRVAAARTLRVPLRQIVVAYTDRGQPLLPGTGLRCSVSHTDGLCVCALSDKAVGVDVERIRPHSPRVASRVFSDGESAMLRGSAQPDKCFFEIWTRRESYVKCLGTGLADLSADVAENARFQTLTVQDAFVVSVCTFTDWS